MLRTLIDFCVRQPVLSLLGAIVVAAIGGYCVMVVPIDAIPNVGENQVIVFTEWPGRSPKDVEDQVTYPLSVALLTVPHAESVRGKSMFGYSFVQITFADGTDFYWARSRVLERLGTAIATLPEGVTPTLGPDATALGQIFYYVLDGPPVMNLAELRTLQDYVVKYELQSVQGVSEVASVGGYVRQYQIEVNPDALRFHDIPLDRLIAAVKDSNIDVGAKTVESGAGVGRLRARARRPSIRAPAPAHGRLCAAALRAVQAAVLPGRLVRQDGAQDPRAHRRCQYALEHELSAGDLHLAGKPSCDRARFRGRSGERAPAGAGGQRGEALPPVLKSAGRVTLNTDIPILSWPARSSASTNSRNGRRS